MCGVSRFPIVRPHSSHDSIEGLPIYAVTSLLGDADHPRDQPKDQTGQTKIAIDESPTANIPRPNHLRFLQTWLSNDGCERGGTLIGDCDIAP